MGDIATKIVELNTVKSSIKSAIANKGIDMTGVPFTEYANKIEGIVTQTEPTIAQSTNYDNVVNKDITVSKDFDGILMCQCGKEKGGAIYVYAKSVSGTFETFELLDDRTQAYGSAARVGCSLYRLKCKANSVIQVYGTNNKSATSGNQNCAYIIHFISYN